MDCEVCRLMKKKTNNIGYKIACLLIGLFALATVLMAWIGGLSTIPKKTVKASADTEYVATIYLSSFYGLFVDNSIMYTTDVPVFTYNFTTQHYTLKSYDISSDTLSTPIPDTTIQTSFAGINLDTYNGQSNFSVSFTVSQISARWSENLTCTAINYFYYRYAKNSSNSNSIIVSINVTLSDGSNNNIVLAFSPTMPFQITNAMIDSPNFNKQIVNISMDNLTSYNNDLAYKRGYADGEDYGYDKGYAAGEIVGYNKGTAEGTHSFKDLFNGVFFAPFHFLYSLLNVELLGVNIYSVFTAILTIGLLSFVVRLLL